MRKKVQIRLTIVAGENAREVAECPFCGVKVSGVWIEGYLMEETTCEHFLVFAADENTGLLATYVCEVDDQGQPVQRHVNCADCGEPQPVAQNWPDGQPVWCLGCYNDQLGGVYA